MKRIDEKVAISGDGAELIQSYLNELNMKLLSSGITESYSIVMEAETLFISEINELNKKTKVTVYEVQKIIEKHGTPDEIVKRYKQAEEAEMEEEFYSMDPAAKELIRRSSNLNSDFQKLKEYVYHGLGLLTLIIPPILYVLALIHLNQYHGGIFIIVILLEIFNISDTQSTVFTLLGGLLLLTQEVLTSRNGKLFISLRNTIRLRTFNRAMLAGGAFSSFFIFTIKNQLGDLEIRGAEIPYNDSVLYSWIFMFVLVESVILARDHISTFFPLQPRFISYENFLKIHYLLLIGAVISFLIAITAISLYLFVISLGLTFVATLSTLYKKYNPGPRFYLILQLLPMIATLVDSSVAILMYIEFLLIGLINFNKYQNDIQIYWRSFIHLIK